MSQLGLNLMNFEYRLKMGVVGTGKGRKEKNEKFD